jgi:hypothetical protein
LRISTICKTIKRKKLQKKNFTMWRSISNEGDRFEAVLGPGKRKGFSKTSLERQTD